MIPRLALTALLLAAPPALAQELTLARPAGCEARMTVFYTQCVAMTLLSCTGDLEIYLRTETARDGVFDSVLLQTMDYRRIAEGTELDLHTIGDPAASKPLPLMELGPSASTMEHDIRYFFNFRGFRRPASFLGTATYSGPITLRSGDVLEEVRLDLTQNLPPPMPPIPGGGSYYLDRTSGFAIEGILRFKWDSDENADVPVPIDLIHPGEPGFDQLTPLGGCDVISALGTETQEVPS